MRRLTKILIAIGATVVLLVALAFAGWYFFLKSDPAPRVSIKKTPVAEGGALDGTYRVSPGDANSIVGYRVQEQLVGGAIEQTTTGRTSEITGSFSITGMTVHDVNVTADLRTLTSDRSQRDNAIKNRGLESNRFPESKFVLSQPINFQSVPKAGQTVNATAMGDFTLHGVTRQVSIPLQGRWDGRDIQVVGTLHIVFADYGITAPTSPVVASIKDEGEMEFQIFFRKV
ncbi:MAG TPA: YceI family protein [Acidimicrobiia bacterium]|jgi:polyisoprenoid-binding protein YceI